jgi:hypothetical protein
MIFTTLDGSFYHVYGQLHGGRSSFLPVACGPFICGVVKSIFLTDNVTLAFRICVRHVGFKVLKNDEYTDYCYMNLTSCSLV